MIKDIINQLSENILSQNIILTLVITIVIKQEQK